MRSSRKPTKDSLQVWRRCQEPTQLSQPHLGHAQKPEFLSQAKYYALKVFSQPESLSIFLFCPSMSDLSANSPDGVSPHTCNYRAQCRRAHSQLDYYNNKNTKELPNNSPNFNCKASSDHSSTSPQTVQLCLPSVSPSYFNFPSQKFTFPFGSLFAPDSFYLNFISGALDHYLFYRTPQSSIRHINGKLVKERQTMQSRQALICQAYPC